MTRSTHRFDLVLTRRPVERLGRHATAESTAVRVEAALDGDPCPVVGPALAAAGRLLAGADLTGWFPDPLLPAIARWLDGRLRPVAEAAGRRLLFCAATTPSLRCEFSPD